MNTIEQKSVRVGKYVNTEHVSNLIRNYKKERWIQNSERLGKEDSLFIWYTVEELEEFIQTAKEHGAEGVRVCFGVYGPEAPKPGMEGRQTVALVATHSEQGDAEMMDQKDLYIGRNGKNTLLAYNQGGVGPWWPLPGVGGGASIGTTIVTDKYNGMRVI